MTPRKLPQNGFWTKLTGIVVGALVVAFFGWLGIAVVEIKENVAGIKGTVDSLVATRAQEHVPPVDSNTERNTRRIEQLEGRGR